MKIIEDERAAAVTSEAELIAALERAEARARETRPVLVDLERDDGTVLSIGVGGERSVLTYSASLDPPYFVSVGGDAEAGDLAFYYGGHWSEFDARQGVAADLAREAALEFFRDGRRPRAVQWEET